MDSGSRQLPMRVKEGYTTGARSLASRSVTGLARTRVTPNAFAAFWVGASCASSTPARRPFPGSRPNR